ncbi:hypothetical protein L9F63_019752 [Diploptera punctata]|uniref:Ionotropic receptor n=1 Tax=Diploptera punctata TaxID=6984 RepID=A0AAD7ZU10_DIPPU|nr:hypothetical protein L9F63_019752 [Diploptera punctata]
MYNPFEFQENNTARGKIHRFKNDKDIWRTYHKKIFKNFHGYPLYISIFSQYPTAIAVNDLTYKGMDGTVLSTLTRYLNITTIFHSPLDSDQYGSVLANGSIVGSLGDVVYGTTNVSLNSRYIKSYDTDDIEFSVPITTDRICFIIPKAKLISKWKNMLICFAPITWLMLLLAYLACSMCFYFLHKVNFPNSTAGDLRVFSTFQVFILSPVNRPPTHMIERFLFALCLFSSLILMNSFQGLLVSNVTSPNYGHDIDTIDELYYSKIPILSKSFQTRSLFINAGHKISNNFVQYKGDPNSITEYLLRTNAAMTERESTIKFLVSKYVSADGTQLLHKVKECTIFYHLAYIFPKGSPYLPRFNYFLKQVIESGLKDKWYWEDVDVKTKLFYRKSKIKQDKNKPFSLSDLQLALYVQFFGLLISFIVFIGEIVKNNFN